MRLQDHIMHPKLHSVYTGLGIDDHHDQPENIEAENNTLVVYPLPGGPGEWDIPVPYEASIVIFSFQSQHVVEFTGMKAGVTGVATRSMIQAAALSIGGEATLVWPSYTAFYAKAAAALNLSHKIFSAAGNYITLSDAWLHETVPGVSRVLRTQWTNYSAGLLTLDARGQIAVVG